VVVAKLNDLVKSCTTIVYVGGGKRNGKPQKAVKKTIRPRGLKAELLANKQHYIRFGKRVNHVIVPVTSRADEPSKKHHVVKYEIVGNTVHFHAEGVDETVEMSFTFSP
jgi:hypothetical protein